jgi:hypothetical protein
VFDPSIGEQYNPTKRRELLTQQHGVTRQKTRFVSNATSRTSKLASLSFLRLGFVELLSVIVANLLVLTENINFSLKHKYEPHISSLITKILTYYRYFYRVTHLFEFVTKTTNHFFSVLQRFCLFCFSQTFIFYICSSWKKLFNNKSHEFLKTQSIIFIWVSNTRRCRYFILG